MYRNLLILAAAGLASPALATAYQAAPAQQPERTVVVTRDNVWRCGAAGCESSGATSRPAVVCAQLVRELGALRSFSVDGRVFTDEELARCNRRAGGSNQG
jgi:hypothetical protein